MKKQTLTAIEIEALSLSNSAASDERRQPVSDDSGAYPQEPETRRRSALHRLIDCFALASCSMAGVYVGVWLDPPNDVARADSPPHRGSGEAAPTAEQ
jgi:hypothetical protein